MFILLDDRNTVIEINKSIKQQEDGSILVGKHLVYNDENLSIVEVDNVPIDILPMKYFYIYGEFVLNTNWINPYSDEDVDKLKQEVKQLNETVDYILTEGLE